MTSAITIGTNLAAPAVRSEPADTELSFWRTAFAQNVLPFLTSLVLHLSLIVLGYLTVQAVKTVVAHRSPVAQVLTPVTAMVDDPADANPDGLLGELGSGGDPFRKMAQDKNPLVDPNSTGLAEDKGPNPVLKLPGGGNNGAGNEAADVIALGTQGRLGVGLGLGKGNGNGSGDGDGTGVQAPFGIPGGGVGIGDRRRIFDPLAARTVHRIAYVCDASGSMTPMFDDLRIEMRKSIENLWPSQSFNVIFFQENGFAAAERLHLTPATSDNKRKAAGFLTDMTAHGETNPIPALELAAAQRPELIYLLTDGDFSGPGNQAVIDFCRTRFAGGATRINTIAFINKQTVQTDTVQAEWVKALQTIASNSGGKFKFVSREDMGQ